MKEEEKSKKTRDSAVARCARGERRQKSCCPDIVEVSERERQESSHGPKEDPDHPDHGREEQTGECLSAPPCLSSQAPVSLSVEFCDVDPTVV